MDHEPRWREGLNQAQLAAVEHDAGPLLVVAGAGTGKTRTLASRVARLVAEGQDPDRILLLTFTRRAAREMVRRADSLGASEASKVWGGTFHSIGHRLLRQHGPAVGLPPRLSVLDQGDATELLGVVRTDLGFAERGARFPKASTLLGIYSRIVNAQEPLATVLQERFPWCDADATDIAAVFSSYTERKRARGMLDYDDLLLYWRALVTASPAAAQVAARFDHVLVDEYQDTNVLQTDIVAGLRPDGDGIFVVGDDAQAIYGFRAATCAAMTTFTTRFPSATVVTLEDNYRSTQPILDTANALMSKAKTVHPKVLRAARSFTVVPEAPTVGAAADEAAQAAFVCQRLLEHREQGIALRHQAVLFRAGHNSDRLEMELGRRRIPFVKYGGLKFLEAAHVKDLLSMVRILENPSDELAWHRTLGMADGVGPATRRSIMASLELPNLAAVRTFVDGPPLEPPRARADLSALRSVLAACLEDPTIRPEIEVEILRTGTASMFERRYDNARDRLTDLEQLQAMAATCATRAQFLSELTIDPPNRTSELAGPPLLDDDFVILSTIHSAKGGEWDVVYVIHAADGVLPSDMSLSTEEGLEEERRLCYVALTRARDHLYVLHPERFYDHRWRDDDPHSLSQPSRFVQEIRHLFVEPDAADAVTLSTSSTPPGPDTVTRDLVSLWS
ncbi:MAG TPA: ATP-dependent helicase [Acidimicrobiales bacterium]|nr:ATP-dependent helicase [Acidimicrobiales bacterium]